MRMRCCRAKHEVMKNDNENAKLILVAEDETDTARLVQLHLERRGWRVLLTADGVAALDETVRSKPDLVILDVMMPRMDGLEVCRLLKSSPQTRHIPVLMLTALAELENKREGYRCGADEYMTKPFSLRELLDRVDGLMRTRELELTSALDFP